MTLSEITRILSDAGIEDARGEAALLIEAFAGVPRWKLLAEKDADHPSPALREAVQKRAERIPLQYLLGKWEFAGLTFRVTPDVLIPRPDTEVIALRAAELLPPGGRFLDLCTGSGCVAGAVLSLAGDKRVTGLAVDLSPAAREVARENLAALGFADRCPVVLGDVRHPEGFLAPEDRFDVIVSNPPYVTAEEMETLAPELSHEPKMALTDGGDGLSLIRAVMGTHPWLAPGGVMLIEHGAAQGEAVSRMAEECGLRAAQLYDYGGNPRAAEIFGKSEE